MLFIEKTVSAIILTLLLVSMLTLGFNIQPVKAEGGTIYIRADGSIDPTTAPIYTADNMTYTLTENITADADGIVIERDNIVVDAAGYVLTGSRNGNGVTLMDRSNVTVRNMTVKDFNCGIYLGSSSNNTVTGNCVEANERIDYIKGNGIELHSSSNNTLSGNNATENALYGISLFESTNNTLYGNNLVNNGAGVELYESSNNTLFGNSVTSNNWEGIWVGYSSNNNVLSGNNIADSHIGIRLQFCINNVLSGNNVTANDAHGIWLDSSSSNNILSDNVMTGSQANFAVEGNLLENYLQSVDASNLADGKPVYYFVNQSDIVMNAEMYPEVGYLGFVNCVNVTVQGLNLTNNGQGLLFAYTNGSKITGNNITASNAGGIAGGIGLCTSSNNVLSGNNVTANNGTGISLYAYSSSNVLSGNNVTANNRYGIYLGWSSNNNVLSGNNVANSGEGILVHYSSNNILSGNIMEGNKRNFQVIGDALSDFLQSVDASNLADGKPVYYFVNQSGIVVNAETYRMVGYLGFVNCLNVTVQGLNLTNNREGLLFAYTNGSKITGNDFANNDFGISLQSSSDNVLSGNNATNNRYGIYLYNYSSNNILSGNNVTSNNEYGIFLAWSSNNSVFHNNFVNNTRQVFNGLSNNIWDDGFPSGGNYWNDYSGADSDLDGIGDSKYTINTGNADRYPLMNPWMLPEHELGASINAPVSLWLGASSSLDAIVTNHGLSDEVNAELWLLINDTITNSTTVPLLQAGDSYTLHYLWTPSVEGTYNVTAYARPVPGETSTQNNPMTTFVTVSVPPEIGVKAGDWINCTYTVSGWPAETPYPEWLKVEFLSVEVTNATIRVTMHMSDGTESNQTMTVDVVAGGGTFQGLSGFLIPANCTTGDCVYMSGYGNVTIAGETTRTYAGASRTAVFASFSQYGTQLTYYWDKLTGVLVEASAVSGDVTATAKATESNIIPEYPQAIILPLLMALTMLTIVFAERKIPRKQKNNR